MSKTFEKRIAVIKRATEAMKEVAQEGGDAEAQAKAYDNILIASRPTKYQLANN